VRKSSLRSIGKQLDGRPARARSLLPPAIAAIARARRSNLTVLVDPTPGNAAFHTAETDWYIDLALWGGPATYVLNQARVERSWNTCPRNLKLALSTWWLFRALVLAAECRAGFGASSASCAPQSSVRADIARIRIIIGWGGCAFHIHFITGPSVSTR